MLVPEFLSAGLCMKASYIVKNAHDEKPRFGSWPLVQSRLWVMTEAALCVR